jgi:hypothetical protein
MPHLLQELGKPVQVELEFETVEGFDFEAFAANATQVANFKAAVRSQLVASFVARNIAQNVTAEHISVTNLRKGSIIVDVEVNTTSISDASGMARLVGALLGDPAALFSPTFYAENRLTGTVTSALVRRGGAASALNLPAIIGGVVGGAGGALLVGIVAYLIIRKRRAGGVEPRGTRGGLLAENGEPGV